MVYFHFITTYRNPIDVTKYCVTKRSYGGSIEVRILADWRQEHVDDENLVAYFQPYDETLRH